MFRHSITHHHRYRFTVRAAKARAPVVPASGYQWFHAMEELPESLAGPRRARRRTLPIFAARPYCLILSFFRNAVYKLPDSFAKPRGSPAFL